MVFLDNFGDSKFILCLVNGMQKMPQVWEIAFVYSLICVFIVNIVGYSKEVVPRDSGFHLEFLFGLPNCLKIIHVLRKCFLNKIYSTGLR